MARRSMAGQLNMFDFWDNLVQPEDGGQVQMVSLIPEEEPKQERAEEVDEEAAQEEPVAQKAVLPEAETFETVDAGSAEAVSAGAERSQTEEARVQEEVLPETVEKVDAGTTGMDLKPEETVQEKQVQEEPVTQKAISPETAPVMQKQVLNPDGSIKAEVAFYNYNKVCVKRENEPEEWREFDNSKEAVEYYMEEMVKLQPENGFEDKGEDDE